MYTPAANKEADSSKLFDLIQQHIFGLLISQHDGEPVASHLPILVNRNHGPQSCLVGHMARANPQWQQADGQSVLAVFSGPHAYISPTWYEAANVVPTWNYVAVHVYGTFRAIHDEHALIQIVHDTVGTYEAAMPAPWKMDRDREFNRKLVKAIVGFRIEITRMEGTMKLSQNHTPERRQKVVRALNTSADQDARAIASLMQKTLTKEP